MSLCAVVCTVRGCTPRPESTGASDLLTSSCGPPDVSARCQLWPSTRAANTLTAEPSLWSLTSLFSYQFKFLPQS